jgi:hypothetical protein
MPNGRKIDQTSVKYTNVFHCKTLQNIPKLGFLFENKPSGNPGCDKASKKAENFAATSAVFCRQSVAGFVTIHCCHFLKGCGI